MRGRSLRVRGRGSSTHRTSKGGAGRWGRVLRTSNSGARRNGRLRQVGCLPSRKLRENRRLRRLKRFHA